MEFINDRVTKGHKGREKNKWNYTTVTPTFRKEFNHGKSDNDEDVSCHF